MFYYKFCKIFKNTYFKELLLEHGRFMKTKSRKIYWNKVKKSSKIGQGQDPVDTENKLNVHKTFRRRPGRLLNVLCTFKLRRVSTGGNFDISFCLIFSCYGQSLFLEGRLSTRLCLKPTLRFP